MKEIIIYPILTIVIFGGIFYFTDIIPYFDPITEHYDLKFIDLKDVYYVDMPITYSFIVTGFGNGCGSYVTQVNDHNGRLFGTSIALDCGPSPSFINRILHVDSNAVIFSKENNNKISEPGEYVVIGEFKQDGGTKITIEKSFEVTYQQPKIVN